MSNFQFPISNFQRGQAVMTAVIFLLFISLLIVFGSVGPAVREFKNSRQLWESKKSYFLAESGLEDLTYRLKQAKNYSNEEALSLDGFFATTTLEDVFEEGKKIVAATSEVNESVRKVRADLIAGAGSSFNYGVQVGAGGLLLQNNSLVSGNVYSNGPIEGQGGNTIKGDAVSAGPSGLVRSIYATGTVYANRIENSVIDKDAYYQTISSTVVQGSSYPASPNQPTSTLPISDEIIAQWEEAASVNIISSPCPYKINSDAVLGPAKITCDVEIIGGPVVTLTGALFITGNLTVQNTATLRLAPALGPKSLAIIVDNPANRLTSSKILLKNTVEVQGSGAEGSFLLLISQNRSAEEGGGEKAIEVENSVSGDLLVYAGRGKILLKNNIGIKEVTAYRIHLQNTANVTYRSGLANLIFDTGPSGSFIIENWEETL